MSDGDPPTEERYSIRLVIEHERALRIAPRPNGPIGILVENGKTIGAFSDAVAAIQFLHGPAYLDRLIALVDAVGDLTSEMGKLKLTAALTAAKDIVDETVKAQRQLAAYRPPEKSRIIVPH